jgi:hypothetical protein
VYGHAFFTALARMPQSSSVIDRLVTAASSTSRRNKYWLILSAAVQSSAEVWRCDDSTATSDAMQL